MAVGLGHMLFNQVAINRTTGIQEGGASWILGETKYEVPGSSSKGGPGTLVFVIEAIVHRVW
jgi:hypothetical protein